MTSILKTTYSLLVWKEDNTTAHNLRLLKNTNKKILRGKWSVIFNETCIKEDLLPKYTKYYIIAINIFYVAQKAKKITSKRSWDIDLCKGLNMLTARWWNQLHLNWVARSWKIKLDFYIDNGIYNLMIGGECKLTFFNIL